MSWGNCPKFCCSKFFKFKDGQLSTPADLTNYIHPVLSKKRFDANVDYSAIEMPLRLASRLLALESVARYIVTMTDAREIAYEKDSDLYAARYQAPGQSEDESDNYSHWRADQILQQAMEHIHFHVQNHIDEYGGRTVPREGHLTQAQAAKLEGPWCPVQAARLQAEGVGSDMNIGTVVYDLLAKFKAMVDQGELLSVWQKGRLLFAQFSFARLVVHELSHSLEYLYRGRCRCERFYKGNNLAERGFDMEAAIFGGLLDGNCKILMETRRAEYCPVERERSAQSLIMVFHPWPSQVYADMYSCRNLKMGILPVSEDARPCTARRVPFSYLERLFTTAYWESNAVRSSGRHPLEVAFVPDCEDWPVRWFPSSDIEVGIIPWLTSQEAELDKAARKLLTAAVEA